MCLLTLMHVFSSFPLLQTLYLWTKQCIISTTCICHVYMCIHVCSHASGDMANYTCTVTQMMCMTNPLPSLHFFFRSLHFFFPSLSPSLISSFLCFLLSLLFFLPPSLPHLLSPSPLFPLSSLLSPILTRSTVQCQ